MAEEPLLGMTLPISVKSIANTLVATDADQRTIAVQVHNGILNENVLSAFATKIAQRAEIAGKDKGRDELVSDIKKARGW